jgi:hypothetical protein
MATSGSPFEVRVNERTNMVVETATGRCLGAAGSNYYATWVFPLYTPAGLTVLREFPFEHPFHNGFFVRQHPVVVGERTGNFWASPPQRGPDDAIFVHVGRADAPAAPTRVEPHDSGVRFTFRITWRDENERPLLEELRSVDFHVADDATICDMSSRKEATCGRVELPQTKFGAIGIRVEPRLLPPMGGRILADGGRCGTAEVVHEQTSAFVAYENAPPRAGRFGVLMHILAPDVRGPWFIRDYGMAMFNPTWTQSLSIPAGESWTVALRVVAYDGALAEDRVRRWLR